MNGFLSVADSENKPTEFWTMRDRIFDHLLDSIRFYIELGSIVIHFDCSSRPGRIPSMGHHLKQPIARRILKDSK